MSKVTMDDALSAGDGVILDELAARIRELEAQRGELLEALKWYAEQAEDLNLYGMASELAEIKLRRDRGKRAKKAIAKAKGERRVLPSPQEPDSFTSKAARAAIAKATGVLAEGDSEGE